MSPCIRWCKADNHCGIQPSLLAEQECRVGRLSVCRRWVSVFDVNSNLYSFFSFIVPFLFCISQSIEATIQHMFVCYSSDLKCPSGHCSPPFTVHPQPALGFVWQLFKDGRGLFIHLEHKQVTWWPQNHLSRHIHPFDPCHYYTLLVLVSFLFLFDSSPWTNFRLFLTEKGQQWLFALVFLTISSSLRSKGRRSVTCRTPNLNHRERSLELF